MPRRLPAVPLAVLLAAAASSARADGRAAVIVADDGGLDLPEVRAIRSVTCAELRRRGVAVSEDPRQDGVQAVDAHLSQLAVSLGAQRLFVVRIGGRLGSKVPLSLDEVAPTQLTTIASASLTATTIEEADVAAQRLVGAVLSHRSADDTATMRTVTAQEARPFQKKPGERFWVVGLPLLLSHGSGGRDTPFGFSLGYMYEAEAFRIGVTGQAASRDDSGIGWLGLDGAWLPFDSELSPYFGAGMGYMGAAGQAGLGARLEAGLELFRLHGVRLMAGVDAVIPLFTGTTPPLATRPVRAVYPIAHLRLAF